MFICLVFFFADPKNDPIRDSDPRNDPNREFFDPLQPYLLIKRQKLWFLVAPLGPPL